MNMVVYDEPKSKPLPQIVQNARGVIARIIDLCHTLEDSRDAVIEALPHLPDDGVIEVRMTARLVGVYAWVIEAAADAEMFARVEAKKGGRGNVDEEEAGKVAAANQQAYLDGKSRATVYRNAQIINTFGKETILTHGNTLQDKGFWITALSAPDPHEAIEIFVEKKTEDPFWEVQDARREIDVITGKHDETKRLFNEKVTTVGRKAACDWLRLTAEPELDKLATSCPFPALANIFRDAQQECREASNALFLQNAQECVLYLWSKGRNTIDQLVAFTCLPRIEIVRVLEKLADKGYFVEKPKAWKSSQGRGMRIKEWHRTDKEMPIFHIELPTGPLKLNLNTEVSS